MERIHEGVEGDTGYVGNVGRIFISCEEEVCKYKPNGEV